MDTHIQGAATDGGSLGAIPSMREFTFSIDSDFPLTLCTIGNPNTTKHFFLEVYPTIYTAFNATSTNVLTLTDQNNNALVVWPDPTSVGVQAYRTIVLTAQTTLILTYTQTGTAATTGKGGAIIRVSGMGTGSDLTQ